MSAFRRLAAITRSFSPSSTGVRYSSNVGSTRPLLLYTAGTPNGRKVSVLLEELRLTYGLDYDVHKITLSENTQKEPWFLKMNPNGRIPVLVDCAREGFTVFETGAILVYLEQHYDKERRFSFDPVRQADDYSEMLQWVFWAHGGLGPMQGQANHFRNAAPEAIPYAQKRYRDETERLYGVLEMRLANRDHLAGAGRGRYTIADINAYPWVAGHKWAGIETLDGWPNMKRWMEMISDREGVQAGLMVP